MSRNPGFGERKQGSRIFVLTGAGISAESGIPVFQGTNWRGHSHYELANIEAWERDPELVWEYYSERRARARDAKPNAAHLALAEFEKSHGPDSLFLCTQNVDGLHEAAGSTEAVHIHGKLFESRCAENCGRSAVIDQKSYSGQDLPRCDCGALLRPSVCWFGERPYHLERVYGELAGCEMFVAIGTSGQVQPVASFVALLKERPQPARTIFVGLAEPANSEYFDEVHLGTAAELIPQFLRTLAKFLQIDR
ncbi:MAG TPA: Sir2 family NAD-dependent protein deacetylase [Candidatus Sulfotelmatobacter sp.]|nr:Sir2 family NAD-dependent protein deacetylase [Candidatus Sulfotelmatobacter sp.]